MHFLRPSPVKSVRLLGMWELPDSRLSGLTSAIRESPTPANKVWNTFDSQLPHKKKLDHCNGRIGQARKLVNCFTQSEQKSELRKRREKDRHQDLHNRGLFSAHFPQNEVRQ